VPKERFTGELPSDTRLSSAPFYSREETGKGGTDSLPLPAKGSGRGASTAQRWQYQPLEHERTRVKGTRYAI
jgi:hypothetical protein